MQGLLCCALDFPLPGFRRFLCVGLPVLILGCFRLLTGSGFTSRHLPHYCTNINHEDPFQSCTETYMWHVWWTVVSTTRTSIIMWETWMLISINAHLGWDTCPNWFATNLIAPRVPICRIGIPTYLLYSTHITGGSSKLPLNCNRFSVAPQPTKFSSTALHEYMIQISFSIQVAR